MKIAPQQIDEAILAVAQARWRKVAMVIVKAAEQLGPGLPQDDTGYEMVARRVEELVRAERLVAQGDISRWRYSEVRLP